MNKVSEKMDVQSLINAKKVVAIMGPTASGKSHLSMALASKLPIEIISVDSALIYRGLDIGSAKPSRDEMARVPHHLINILNPIESYSASNFVDDVHRLVADIFSRGRLPVLVGGTMMYFHALQQGMAKLPAADETIRVKLQQDWEDDAQALHAQLARVDSVAAERIHFNDQQRVCRALEVFEITGTPLSQLQEEGKGRGLTAFTLIKIALLPEDRKQLHKQIETRFRGMLDQGFMKEVETLFKDKTLHSDLPAIRCVGYRQAWNFLSGETDFDTFIDKGLVATRQLAKRQMTWLRKEENVRRLDAFQLTKEQLMDETLKVVFS